MKRLYTQFAVLWTLGLAVLFAPTAANFLFAPQALKPFGVHTSSSGHTVTANFGGTGACVEGGASPQCLNGTDNGNANIAFDTPFISPANALSWSSFNVMITTPQAPTVHNGLALYSDTTSGCPSGATHCPLTLICGNVITTQYASGWNQPLSTAGCGTPTSSTWYHLVQITDSNSQHQGTTGISGYCPNVGGTASMSIFQSTFGTWTTGFPTTFPLSGASITGNGCYAAYASISYTSNAKYDLVSLVPGDADCAPAGANNGCSIAIPPAQNPDGIVVAAFNQNSPGTVTISSVYDCTGPLNVCTSSTDTFTDLGCSTVNGSAPAYGQVCLFAAPSVTAGVNNITVNMSANAGGKYTFIPMEWAGTKTSSFVDQSAFGSTFLAQNFTGPSTGTTAVATELAIGPLFNYSQGSTYSGFSTFTPSGSWGLLYQGGGSGNSPVGLAIFYQVLSAIGTYDVTGTASLSGNLNLTALGTFE